MRKISFLLCSALILMLININVLAEQYVAVSVGKPVKSFIYGDGGKLGNTYVDRAVDGNLSTQFQSSTDSSVADSITVDLEKAYTFGYATVQNGNYYGESFVYLSADEDFTNPVMLELTDGQYYLPRNIQKKRYRYARLTVPKEETEWKVREFTVYVPESALEESDEDPDETSEEFINVAKGKPINSVSYGAGGFLSKSASANDGDTSTTFTSTVPGKDALIISFGKKAYISYASVNIRYAYYTGTERIYLSQTDDFETYIELEKKDDGMFYMPDNVTERGYAYLKFTCGGGEQVDLSAMHISEIEAYESTYDAAMGKVDAKQTIIGDEKLIDLQSLCNVREIHGVKSVKAGLFNAAALQSIDAVDNTIFFKNGMLLRYIVCAADENPEIFVFESSVVKANDSSLTVKNISYSGQKNYRLFAPVYSTDGEILTFNDVSFALDAGTEQTFAISDGMFLLTDEKLGIIAMSGEPETQTAYEENDYFTVDTLKIDSMNGGAMVSIDKEKLSDSDKYVMLLADNDNKALQFLYGSCASLDGSVALYVPENAAVGTYKAIVTVTNAYGKMISLSADISIEPIPEDKQRECVSSFMSANEDDVEALLDNYYIKEGYLRLSAVKELDIKTIAKAFIIARDMRTSLNGDMAEISTCADVTVLVKMAVVLEAFIGGNAADIEACVQKYGWYLPKLFSTAENINNLPHLYKKSGEGAAALLDDITLAVALCSIYKQPTSQIAKALTTYSEVLKVDEKLIEENKIDILEIAKRLDNEVPSSYYNGLSDEISEIVSALKAKKPTVSGCNAGGGGGSGGGIGISGSMVTTKVPEVQPEKNEAAQEEQIFRDVPASHWAYKNITRMYRDEIINGDENGYFQPQKHITRAEFIKMLVLAFDISIKNNKTMTFSDCNVGDWYYSYMDAAFDNGIIHGMDDGSVGANKEITRQDMAVMCINLLSHLKLTNFSSIGTSFKDVEEISDYAEKSVLNLASLNVITGFEDGTFRPFEKADRAQAAVITGRLIDTFKDE